MPERFAPGTLWQSVLNRTRRALACGALRPIQTSRQTLWEGDVPFVVRSCHTPCLLTPGAPPPANGTLAQEPADPFLPFEPDLFVADVSPTHLCLLNKFSVLEHHLLIVTRQFEDQEMLLDLSDFEALWACMVEFDSLGFYNGGRTAGASQAHKHLQLVPLPLIPGVEKLPVEQLLRPTGSTSRITTCDRLPFQHRFAALAPPSDADTQWLAQAAHRLYLDMLSATGIDRHLMRGGKRQENAYNLLLTRDWMMLIPRSRARFNSISINALGFAGSLFVQGEEQMRTLRDLGPMAVLAGVALPRDQSRPT